MSADPAATAPDWEAFHRNLRQPGYVRGYEILGKLGSGMSGQVYRARKASIGKDYAIKFLQIDDAEVARAVQAELDQLRHFAQIDHPNLVAIEDRGLVDGIPVVVMAFAGSETLRDRMPRGAPPAPADLARLRAWFAQAAAGVQALHDHGLVHFDVKPQNVFLKGDVARVGDFGLSKLADGSRASLSAARGTPHYMAPEVLDRRGDRRSDVYSLGCILYELLCGQPPFVGDDAWQVMKQHASTPPTLPPHLSARDREALQRCLAKDPAARFASVRDLLAALGEPLAALAAAAAAGAPIAPTAAVPPPGPGAPRAPLPPPLPPAVHPAAPGDNAAAAAPVWRPRLAAFLRRLEPLHGGLGIVGLMVALAVFAALAARCGGAGR
jgi:serine/threonine-protein kinase